MKNLTTAGFLLGLCAAIYDADGVAIQSGAPAPDIPKTWDDEEVAKHEIPLANPVASPKHVSSDYY